MENRVKNENELILLITNILREKSKQKNNSFTLRQLVDEIYKSEQFGKFCDRDKLFSEVELILNHFIRSDYFYVKKQRYYPVILN